MILLDTSGLLAALDSSQNHHTEAAAVEESDLVEIGSWVVGREGFEPPQLSRVVYSHLSSPMPSRPTKAAETTAG